MAVTSSAPVMTVTSSAPVMAVTSSAPVNLSGVPETMLWTLHNRATEAKRSDGLIRDPEATRVYESIAYDYFASFGKPDGSHAARSSTCDAVVKTWMAKHPGGTVVELGCGLETQFKRIDDGKVQWVCVDVPDAIDTRERFLPPSERCRHVRKSCLDQSWFNEVDNSKGVMVTAQGLIHYLGEEPVRELFTAILDRFPGVEMFFDCVPRWFSQKTMEGFYITEHYKCPEMPFGVDQHEIAPLLNKWSPRVTSVQLIQFPWYRGWTGFILPLLGMFPIFSRYTVVMVHVCSKAD